IVERGEPRRIAGFIGCEQADADLAAGREFGARIFLAADPPRTIRAAAPRQIRQPLQRGAGAAEMIDQGAEGAWPDIVTADQPQAVDPLRIGEVGGAWCFDVHAAPSAIASRNRRVGSTRFKRAKGLSASCPAIAVCLAQTA